MSRRLSARRPAAFYSAFHSAAKDSASARPRGGRRARRRVLGKLVAGATALVVLAMLGLGAGPTHSGGAGLVLSASTSTPTAFAKTETISRISLVAGKNVVQDRRTVSLKVTNTAGLRDRQEVDVSWSGAHPTGGVVSNENSVYGEEEEYPMVLLECRGIDSTKVAVADRLAPDTCYTQTPNERYEASYGDEFPPWRLDRDAANSELSAAVDEPSPLPSACGSASAQPEVQHWLPFVSVTGKSYYGGPNGCAGLAPEQSDLDNPDFPSNATYGVTAPNGTGSAKFVVFTSESNASLGCSDVVPCSLVAVPIMGISCDAAAAGRPASDRPTAAEQAAAQSECMETGTYSAGQQDDYPNQSEDVAVAGELWWAASNWQNRITVPLQFAPPSNVCSTTSTSTPLDLYGSEMLYEAAVQWEPYFCLNKKLFNWNLVMSSEPEATSLLAGGSIQAAVATDPAANGFTTPTVQAPAAVSGFAIAYDIDDSAQQPLPALHLDARLLAKLLTESYPGDTFMEKDDPGLAGNPLDITDDPEFKALNPGAPQNYAVSEVASTILQLSTSSDLMTALTSYINANPEARAWLNGKPDPWGMVVNPAYKGIKLPVSRWPLLDTVLPATLLASTSNPCYNSDPSPWMSLIADPSEELQTTALDMQYALAQPETVCSQPVQGSTAGEELTTLGPEQPGSQFMIGLVSLADAQEYQLATASLQTTNTGSTTTFTTAGRTFVAPTTSSLRAAADTMTPDKATGTWVLPYGAKASAAGYPGTMLLNLDVPTKGLTQSEARDYGELMSFTAGRGQLPGSGNGDLPAGYLPLTSGNGLGAERAYTLRAAAAVTNQSGAVPPLVGTGGTGKAAGGTTSNPTAGAGSVPGGNVGASESGETSLTGPLSASATPAPSPHPPVVTPSVLPSSRPKTSSSPPRSTLSTLADGTGAAGLLLPGLLALILGALTTVAVRLRRARRSAP